MTNRKIKAAGFVLFAMLLAIWRVLSLPLRVLGRRKVLRGCDEAIEISPSIVRADGSAWSMSFWIHRAHGKKPPRFRWLSLLLVLAFAAPSTAAQIHGYPLSDNAANTVVDNTIGADAALVGGDNTSVVHTTGPGGTITSGFLLNGVDDRIDISASSISFADAAAFSVSGWIKCTSAPTADCIMGTSAATQPCLFAEGDTSIRYRTSASADVTFTVPALGTTWHHVLVTRTTGNSMRVFVDGVESVSGAQTAGGTFAPNRIGRNSDGGTHFNGSMAQFKVYNSDESANVAALYAEGVSAINPLSKSIPANGLDPLRGL